MTASVFGRGIVVPAARRRRRAHSPGREGEANIRESIAVILMTEPGERVGVPEFGGGLGALPVRAEQRRDPRARAGRGDARARALGAAHRGRVASTWRPTRTTPRAAIATITYRLVATGGARAHQPERPARLRPER